MHAIIDRATDRDRAGGFYASFPAAAPAPAAEPPIESVPPARYGASTRPRWVVVLAVLALHLVLLAVLMTLDVISVAKRAPTQTIVLQLDEPPPPPQVAPQPQPETKPLPVEQVVTPPPIVQPVAPPPPPIHTVSTPPPAQAVVAAPAAPRIASPAPSVSQEDIASDRISGDPPRYPMESRRKRESGNVDLQVTLGLDGRVASIAVSRSSGFARLDDAALGAVKHWRWKPALGGSTYILSIPFAISG